MALSDLRKAGKSWVGIILVGFLVLSFAVWGVADIFGYRQGRGVAKVGDLWIEPETFSRRLQSELRRYSEQMGQPLSAEDARNFGVTDQVLQSLIDFKAIEAKGSDIGLAVSNDSVVADIRQTPAFFGAEGSFDSATYERVLRDFSYTPQDYEDSLRGDIIREQMIWALTSGVMMPRGLVEALIVHRTERRSASYLVLNAGDVAEPATPSDEALEQFISERESQFSTAEARSFVVLLLKPDDFVGEVVLSDDEIKQQFEFDKVRYMVAETREVRTLAFPDEASANASLRRINEEGSTFEDEAEARGMGEADLAFNTTTQADMFDEQVGEAVFTADEPGLIGPINGALAWTIAEVKTITPGREKTLEEVREQIETELSSTRSVDVLYEKINVVEDYRAEGQSLEEIAERMNLRVEKVAMLTRDGTVEESGAKPLNPLGAVQNQIIAEAFDTEEGLENDFRQAEDGSQFVVRLDSIAMPKLKPMDVIRQDALTAYAAFERRKALQEKAQTLLAETQTAGGLQAAAAKLGREPEATSEPLGRQTQHPVLSVSLIQDLFGAKKGELVIGNAADSDNWVLATTTNVIAPSTAEISAGITQVGPQMDRALSDGLARQYINGARQDLGVRIDQTVLNAAITGAR